MSSDCFAPAANVRTSCHHPRDNVCGRCACARRQGSIVNASHSCGQRHENHLGRARNQPVVEHAARVRCHPAAGDGSRDMAVGLGLDGGTNDTNDMFNDMRARAERDRDAR